MQPHIGRQSVHLCPAGGSYHLKHGEIIVIVSPKLEGPADLAKVIRTNNPIHPGIPARQRRQDDKRYQRYRGNHADQFEPRKGPRAREAEPECRGAFLADK
jgi:hypothetical protein